MSKKCLSNFLNLLTEHTKVIRQPALAAYLFKGDNTLLGFSKAGEDPPREKLIVHTFGTATKCILKLNVYLHKAEEVLERNKSLKDSSLSLHCAKTKAKFLVLRLIFREPFAYAMLTIFTPYTLHQKLVLSSENMLKV